MMKTKICILLSIIFLTGSMLCGQNAPTVTAGTVVSDGSVYTVPVTVTNFSNIGSCSLRLTYNASLATALSVTKETILPGNLASNLGVPGIITLGWYTWPGASLPDNTVVFNITFAKILSGPVALTWIDDGYSCQWWDSNGDPLNDLPLAGYYNHGSVSSPADAPLTMVPDLTACPGSETDVPITVFSFNNIGSVSLTLQYDPSVLDYRSSVNNSAYPDLSISNPSPGTIKVTGNTQSGVTLTAGSALVILKFGYSGGTTEIAWADNGSSCEYKGPSGVSPVLTDSPQSSYYQNGSVSITPQPDAAGNITSAEGATVVQGQSGVVYSVPAINNATGYEWSLPPGAEITKGANTNSITVSFSMTAVSGEIHVAGTNACQIGAESASFDVTVNISNGIEWFGSDGNSLQNMAIRAYPNPFSNQVSMDYYLPASGKVTIEILNLLGVQVATLTEDKGAPGEYHFNLETSDLSQGIYLARIILRTSDRIMVSVAKLVCNR
jgi:hypothetical protein